MRLDRIERRVGKKHAFIVRRSARAVSVEVSNVYDHTARSGLYFGPPIAHWDHPLMDGEGQNDCEYTGEGKCYALDLSYPSPDFDPEDFDDPGRRLWRYLEEEWYRVECMPVALTPKQVAWATRAAAIRVMHEVTPSVGLDDLSRLYDAGFRRDPYWTDDHPKEKP